MTRPDTRDPERFPAALSAEASPSSAERTGRPSVTCGNCEREKTSRTSPFRVELPGFEPRTTEPKSAVLPLHHSSNIRSKAAQRYVKNPNIQFCAGRLSFTLADCLSSAAFSGSSGRGSLRRGNSAADRRRALRTAASPPPVRIPAVRHVLRCSRSARRRVVDASGEELRRLPAPPGRRAAVSCLARFTVRDERCDPE